MPEIARTRYAVGTIVIRNSGYTFIRTQQGLIPEHRFIMEQSLGRELLPGEKVIHFDNTLRGVDPEGFNRRDNLGVVKCRTTKWVPIRSRVLYVPKEIPKYKSFSSK